MVDIYSNDRRKFLSIPVMKCAINNDIDGMNKLVEENPDIVNFVHKKSADSPIMVAARHKRFNILKLLHEHGADIEHKNTDGKRVLHEAALSGCLDCIDYLLQQKINIDSLKRADWTPLMFACAQGHIEIIKKLLKHGANVTRVNKDGWNCFHLACREGLVTVLECLLEFDNSTWNTHSKNLRTPLHTASMHGRRDTVNFLLKHCKYKTDAKDSCGTTPLMDSFRFGFVDIADLLIKEHGTDFYETDSLGRSCIHIAAHSGQLDSIRYLTETCKLDINLPCLNSTTNAVHLAAKEGHVEAVKFIISIGGILNSVDKNNRTALHLATAGNKLEVMKLLLLELDVDRSVIDCCGKTALEYALTDDAKLCFG